MSSRTREACQASDKVWDVECKLQVTEGQTVRSATLHSKAGGSFVQVAMNGYFVCPAYHIQQTGEKSGDVLQ